MNKSPFTLAGLGIGVVLFFAVNVLSSNVLRARADFTDEYRERFANPYKAASLGYIDEIIRPRDTRPVLIRALQMLGNKRQQNPPRKHGNIPL